MERVEWIKVDCHMPQAGEGGGEIVNWNAVCYLYHSSFKYKQLSLCRNDDTCFILLIKMHRLFGCYEL